MKIAHLLLTLLLTASLRLAAGPFSDQLPNDVLLLVHINNQEALGSKIAASPLGKTFQKVDWKGLLTSFAQGIEEDGEEPGEAVDPLEIRREIDLFAERWAGISSHFSGQAAIVIGDMSEMMALVAANKPTRDSLYENIDWDLEEDPAFEAALRKEQELDAREELLGLKNTLYMVEVRDGDGLLAKMADWARESLQEQDADEDLVELVTHDWNGLQVYTFVTRPDEDASAEDKALIALESNPWWTVSNGVLIATLSETGLRNALERQKNPPAQPLSSLPAFIESQRHIGESDLLVFINFPRADAMLRPMIAAEQAAMDPAEMGQVSPLKIMDWLALDALLPYSLGLRFDDLGVHTRGRFGFSRECGLSRLLVDPSDAPAPRPAFIHRNVMQVSSAQWGMGRFYEALEKELGLIAPQASAALGMGRALAAGQLGFDFKLQFLDHFGSGLVFVQDIDTAVLNRMLDLAQNVENGTGDPEALMAHTRQNPTNGQYYLFGLEVKNRDALSATLNTLIGKIHPNGAPAPEDYKGQPLHFPMPDMGDMGPSPRMIGYTFLDGYLVISIGNPALLRQAVDASQDAASRLWAHSGFQAMEALVPEGGQVLDYTSGNQQEASMAVLQRSLSMLATQGTGAPLPDFTALGQAFRQAIGTSVRKGLVFELTGFIEFGKAP